MKPLLFLLALVFQELTPDSGSSTSIATPFMNFSRECEPSTPK